MANFWKNLWYGLPIIGGGLLICVWSIVLTVLPVLVVGELCRLCGIAIFSPMVGWIPLILGFFIGVVICTWTLGDWVLWEKMLNQEISALHHEKDRLFLELKSTQESLAALSSESSIRK